MKFVNPKDNIAFKPAEKAMLKAYARQGLQELRNAFYPESNLATSVDYGIWGKLTPGEVSSERNEPSASQDLLQAEQEKLRKQCLEQPQQGRERGLDK